MKDVKKSLLFKVEVNDGAVPPGHLKEAGHVTDLAVPSPINPRTKDDVLPEFCTLDIVKVVILLFKFTSNTAAWLKSSVSVFVAIVGAALPCDAVFVYNDVTDTFVLLTVVVPIVNVKGVRFAVLVELVT